MKRTHKMLLTGGAMVAVLLPAGTAMAATATPGVCDGTGQHQMLRDGTGSGPNWSANAPGRQAMSGTAKGVSSKAPYGKQDGSGPLHTVRPLNGTGRQLGYGRA